MGLVLGSLESSIINTPSSIAAAGELTFCGLERSIGDFVSGDWCGAGAA